MKLFTHNYEFPYRNIHWIVQGFIHVIDGLLMIFSLGFYCSSLAVGYIEWVTHQKFKRLRKK